MAIFYIPDHLHNSTGAIQQHDEKESTTKKLSFLVYGQRQLPLYLEALLKQQKKLLKEITVEGIHKMRVAARRLRTTLDAYQSIAKPKSLQKASRQVKEVAHLSGRIRDVDVLHSLIAEPLLQMPVSVQEGAQWLLQRFSEHRKRRQQELKLFLRTFDSQALRQAVTTSLPDDRQKQKKRSRLDPQGDVDQNAYIVVEARLKEYAAQGSWAQKPYAVRELHRLRIAAKHLRYTLEIFKDVLSPHCSGIIEELKTIQDQMGVLHDNDVLIASLRLCLVCQENPRYGKRIRQTEQRKQGLLDPGLVAILLEPQAAPTAIERAGLEWIVRRQEDIRDQQYQTFLATWLAAQKHDLAACFQSSEQDGK